MSASTSSAKTQTLDELSDLLNDADPILRKQAEADDEELDSLKEIWARIAALPPSTTHLTREIFFSSQRVYVDDSVKLALRFRHLLQSYKEGDLGGAIWLNHLLQIVQLPNRDEKEIAYQQLAALIGFTAPILRAPFAKSVDLAAKLIKAIHPYLEKAKRDPRAVKVLFYQNRLQEGTIGEDGLTGFQVLAWYYGFRSAPEEIKQISSFFNQYIYQVGPLSGKPYAPDPRQPWNSAPFPVTDAEGKIHLPFKGTDGNELSRSHLRFDPLEKALEYFGRVRTAGLSSLQQEAIEEACFRRGRLELFKALVGDPEVGISFNDIAKLFYHSNSDSLPGPMLNFAGYAAVLQRRWPGKWGALFVGSPQILKEAGIKHGGYRKTGPPIFDLIRGGDAATALKTVEQARIAKRESAEDETSSGEEEEVRYSFDLATIIQLAGDLGFEDLAAQLELLTLV